MLFSSSGNGLLHTVVKYNSFKAAGETGSAIHKREPLTSNVTAGAVDPAAKNPEKNLPVECRFIAVQTYRPILNAGNNLTASVTDGAMFINGHYSNNSSHFILNEFGVTCIDCKTIDSNKGIEYFLSSWHLVFSLSVAGEERRSVSNEPNANFFI
jgi:Na+/citrate or Na+/malate symporter